MGLLRKAATTAIRGDTAIAAPPAPAPDRHPVSVGLLRKSLSLHATEQAPALNADIPVLEAAAPLSVELAGTEIPAAETALAEEPLEELAVELPPAEEPPLEELAAEAPPAEEPPLVELAAEAPPAEEPPLVELAVEAAPAEEPLFEPPVTVRAADLEPEAPAAEPQTAAVPLMQAPDALISELIVSLQSLHEGVELPAQLFTVLASRLSIQKGAFLLYDPLRLVYAPWASKGYDQTTLHRLRIPLGANESWNALANGNPLIVADPQSLSSYQQYFSSRESGSLSRIILTPFIAEEKLIAVLIITDASPPFEGDEPFLQCLTGLARAGSPLVHAARSAQLAQKADRAPHADAAPEDEASRFISSFDPSIKSVLLLALSTEDYAKKVIASHEHLDPFRLHEDMRYFLGSFLTDLGRAMSPRPGLFVVGLTDFPAEDVDLFIHQLSLFFNGLFGGNGRAGAPAGPRCLNKLAWPSDGGDMRALIESLSG